MNQNQFIQTITAYAIENNTIEVCNKTIQLIAAIADEVGVEGADYVEALNGMERCAEHIADSLTGNMGHGYITKATNKAFKILQNIK